MLKPLNPPNPARLSRAASSSIRMVNHIFIFNTSIQILFVCTSGLLQHPLSCPDFCNTPYTVYFTKITMCIHTRNYTVYTRSKIHRVISHKYNPITSLYTPCIFLKLQCVYTAENTQCMHVQEYTVYTLSEIHTQNYTV